MEINTNIWFNWSMFAFIYQTLVERANDVAEYITNAEAHKADLKKKHPECTARQIEEYYESILKALREGMTTTYTDAESKSESIGVQMPFNYEELTDFIDKGGIWK